MNSTNLIQTMTPDICGLIWITEQQISELPTGFLELDYLLDGTLTDFLKSKNFQESNKNLFFGDQFGHPFFVGHIVNNGQVNEDDLFQILQVAKGQTLSQNKVLVFGGSESIVKKCEKKFKEFQFTQTQQ